MEVETLLREAGFAPNEGKLGPVRYALEAQTEKHLLEVKTKLGTDITMLVMLCIRRHLRGKGLLPEERQSEK